MQSFNSPLNSIPKGLQEKLEKQSMQDNKKGGSLKYSSKAAGNYVKAVQEGKINEVLESIKK